MNGRSGFCALVAVLLAAAFLVSMVPSAEARARPGNGPGSRGFEREARQLGKILKIDPWTAAELLEDDKDLRLRAGMAIDAQRRRNGGGTALMVPGLVLTVVGVIVTSVASAAHHECDYNCESTGDSRALGTGIGFLVAGVGMSIPGIVLLATPSREARELADWYGSRKTPAAPAPAPETPGGVEPDDDPAPPPAGEAASSLVPVRRGLRGTAHGGNTFVVNLLSVPF